MIPRESWYAPFKQLLIFSNRIANALFCRVSVIIFFKMRNFKYYMQVKLKGKKKE